MAIRSNFKMSTSQKRLRYFSDNFKREKVRDIEMGLVCVVEICKQYELSATNGYKWIYKFVSIKQKKERIIVENQSDTRVLLELKKKLADLERIIGRKQILLDFKDKMIEIAEEMYGVDIKKNFLSNSPILLLQ